ncbi:hypothetical protein SCHPADRAFT_907142 [Schizopora paradoxa]|uniref:Uncharacterized protein n=1 Tax=Schizopora paradoxa TaxID=27342 RepID=A0A0H2RKY8_9AGAM|nr:hypothetical protein SCHPADRAFT_907142 [Schizopora paradoxa]
MRLSPESKAERANEKIEKELVSLEKLWNMGEVEKDTMSALKEFIRAYPNITKTGYTPKDRPAFLAYFMNQTRRFTSFPILSDDEEARNFATSFHQWMFQLAPPSCVAGRTRPVGGIYRTWRRVDPGEWTEADTTAWANLFNGGRNGAILLCLCLAVWKGNGKQFHGTAYDYSNALSDVKWIFDEGLRVNRKA